jgi:cytidine deaminase
MKTSKSVFPLSALRPIERRLVKAAQRAASGAYCPYSNFPVGAAVLTYDNKIFTGCNIENCSSGATICAERVAIFKAISEGYRRIRAIAIYAPKAPKLAQSCGCGICRQVIAEFGMDAKVLKLRNDGAVIVKIAQALLPHAFTPSIMGKLGADDKTVIRTIQSVLTPDLLKKRYRNVPRKNKLSGHCYAASEAYYHMRGGAESGFVPMVLRLTGGGTHWFLQHVNTGKIVDITARQFPKRVNYAAAKACGFLTKKPSKRASTIIARTEEKMAARAA